MFKVVNEIFSARLPLELSVVVISTLIGLIVAKRFLQKLKNSSKVGKWLQSLGASLYGTSSWIIICYGLLSCMYVFARHVNVFAIQIAQIRTLFLIIVISILLFRWKRHFEVSVLTNKYSKTEQVFFLALSKLFSVIFFGIMLLFILDVFGISLHALLAFGGISGIAVGWAAKDIIANFFAGLMIYLNQPFLIGDWVYLPSSNVEGVVEDISWYMTSIRTVETRPIYIPNAIVLGSIIQNPGRMFNRHIRRLVRIRLQDMSSAKNIVDSLKGGLQDHIGIDQKRNNTIYVVNFGEHSIDIDVSIYTKTTNNIEFLKVQQEILFNIIYKIKEYGGEITVLDVLR